MRLAIAAMACALAVSGCATAYGEMGFTGGVSAAQIGPNQWRITAAGNAYTDADTISDFAMRKAAETTLEQGYEWFGIVSSEDRTRSELGSFTTPSTTNFSASQFGNTVSGTSTTYGGGTSVYSMTKPGRSMVIEMGRGQRPRGAFDAAETLRYMLPLTGGS